MDAELDDLHKPPFNCGCGRGNRVLATGGLGEICTRTLVLFREQHGHLPAMWMPLRPVEVTEENHG